MLPRLAQRTSLRHSVGGLVAGPALCCHLVARDDSSLLLVEVGQHQRVVLNGEDVLRIDLAGVDSPKSEAGERTIALGQKLAAELFDHRARTNYGGDDERVFCSPTKGTPFDVQRYAATFRAALKKAGITDYVRPFHDQRHSSITNSAAAGASAQALMARAGHSDFKTTQLYIDLAGETFREDAERLERRLWGSTSPRSD